MSRFSQAIQSNRFLVTMEAAPPKGTDAAPALKGIELMRAYVDGVNATDQQGSVMRSSPWALCKLMLDRGVEPIMQVTARDRNRIALQAEILAAAILGIENVLLLTGDPTGMGDHPDAKAVFDLGSVTLVTMARTLEQGKDMAGNALQGTPKLCIGVAASPGMKPLEPEIEKLKQKVEAGARFVQTQPVFDLEEFATFMERIRGLDVAVLGGLMPLKSAKNAAFLNANIPGVHVPDSLAQEIDRAEEKSRAAIEIMARTVRGLRKLCRGVHVMPMGWERYVPEALAKAGIEPKTASA
ncbi:MAG: methylenetetrahydrofolate reductase [Chloroflexi bacterium]|nr:methylenetetrahydrofolate reductase [Chloroflexota bacterium]